MSDAMQANGREVAHRKFRPLLLCAALLGGLWLVWALVDYPVARWMMARTDLHPWMFIKNLLRPLGSGIPQGIVLLTLLTLGLGLDRPRLTRAAKYLLCAFVVGTLVATMVKWTVRRPRPSEAGQPRPPLSTQIESGEWHSFPSGDVTATSAVMIVLWGLLGQRRRWQWLLVVPVLVAVQRVLAARHFPSDVLAGLVLGAWAGVMVLQRITPMREWGHLPTRREAGSR